MSVANAQVVNSVVEEGGFISLCRYQPEREIVEMLQQLRKENYQAEITFTIDGLHLTEGIASELIRTFQYYANSNLRWNEINFENSFESDRFFRVVEAAAKLKLFRRLRFWQRLDFEGSERPLEQYLSTRLAAAVAFVIQEGRHLERLTIENFEISANSMAVLATGLATAGQTVGLTELRFSNNIFVGRYASGGLMGAPEYLAAGLASNRTLKKFRIINGQRPRE